MNKLNVNVGDVVRVIYPQDEKLSYVAIVEKVLPNGRFKTERCEEYWRADGTKNTHAKAWGKDQYVVSGSINDYKLKYGELIAHRLRLIANTIERLGLNVSIQGLSVFNKILTAYGWENDDEIIAKLERTMHDKEMIKFITNNKVFTLGNFSPEELHQYPDILGEI